MKRFLLILVLPALFACSDARKDYYVIVNALWSISTTVYKSDRGVDIRVVWKTFHPRDGKATLFDGGNNPVLNCDIPTQWDDPANDSVAVIRYEFTPQDKAGDWRLVMSFGDEEIVHGFTVLPESEDPTKYQALACVTTDGRVAPHNFYQLSNSERDYFAKGESSYWDLQYVIYEIKKRSYMCGSGETQPDNWDDWEGWFEQVSGKRVRQRHPVVHERIAAVMPVYEEEFLFLNPEFVQWFLQTMVPDPNESPVNGLLYQQIYDYGLRDDAREMALTFLYYQSLPDSGLEAQVAYAELAARKYLNVEEDRVMERSDYFNLSAYITENYEEASAEWVASRFGNEVIGGKPYRLHHEDLSFWLRRGIDGSANELWVALCEVLKKYDTHWYNQIIQPNSTP